MNQKQPHQEGKNHSPIRGGGPSNDHNGQDQHNGSPGSQDQHPHYMSDGNGSQNGEDTATNKLVGSRQARKRAEEDVKLLQNRIALLKMEEKKAWKKIEDTKKKAKEIMQVKQRNQEQQKIKDQRVMEKELEERMLAERNQSMKNQIKETIQMSKEQHQKKLLEEAERLKLEKREQKELANMQKQQEYLKNASMKQMIKTQEQEVQELKRKEAAEKKAKTRQDLQQKIIQENQRRLQIEVEVVRMEQEELELIQKLQNTQIMQKAAYEDLEGALNNQISPESLKQNQNQQKDFSPVKNFSDQKGGRPQTADRSQIHNKPSPSTQVTLDSLTLADIVANKTSDYNTSNKTLQNQYRSYSQVKTRPSDTSSEIDRVQSDSRMAKLTGISKIVNIDAEKSYNSSLSKRRIHQDGIFMLDSHLLMKDSKQKMVIMENRIKRLIYEEERAKKLQNLAKQKADKMLEARDRHQKDLIGKFRFYEEKMLTIQEQKEKNLIEKMQRRKNIQKVKIDLQLRNRHNKLEMFEENYNLNQIKSQYQTEEMNEKKFKKFQILQTKNMQLTHKKNNLENHNQNVKQNYSSRLMENKLQKEEANEQIKKLEQMEMALIDRLKTTYTQQQIAYNSLEKIVHDGYDYYLNSFKDKRERQSSLYCNSSRLAAGRQKCKEVPK